MLFSVFILALRSVQRNLLRSFLTILGIVIGVSAVITMVTLGNGATQATNTQISSLGAPTNGLKLATGIWPAAANSIPMNNAPVRPCASSVKRYAEKFLAVPPAKQA